MVKCDHTVLDVKNRNETLQTQARRGNQARPGKINVGVEPI